jgi:hypothetical protein
VGQCTLAGRIGKELESAEANRGHFRSLVVGDFNTDPFDDAMINSDTLHAIASRQIAAQASRIVEGAERRFLYNPMHSLMGDLSPGPPGSYYYRKTTSSCRFWHLFDQVLLRPQLAEVLHTDELQVVTFVGQTSLTKDNGQPDPEVGSDHFPLVFKLDLQGAFAYAG